MTGPTKTSEPPRIRLVFQLERAELPRLYDELARFHKGVSASADCVRWPTRACWSSRAS